MAGSTPTYAIPYPLGTDRVMDGDDAMRAIAERVETVWQYMYTEVTIASGSTFQSKVLTFPTPFGSIPTVLCNVATKTGVTAGYYAHAYGVSASACTVRADKLLGAAPGSPVVVGIALMVGVTKTVL